MTPDERAQLIEDIRRSNVTREQIVERASGDKQFDIAAAWETVEELDRFIYTRILKARSKSVHRRLPLHGVSIIGLLSL